MSESSIGVLAPGEEGILRLEGVSCEMYMVNLETRAASLMKLPTSVEFDHWNSWPVDEVLRKDMVGVAGVKEPRMSRLT